MGALMNSIARNAAAGIAVATLFLAGCATPQTDPAAAGSPTASPSTSVTQVEQLPAVTTTSAPPATSLPAAGLALVYLEHGEANYLTTANGGGVQRVSLAGLGDHSYFDPANAAIAPNGKLAAWIHGRTGGLMITGFDGAGASPDVQVIWGCGSPAWSPDSRRVVFATGSLDSPRLQIINADGSGRHTLDIEGGCWPTWSLDGSLIAYVRDGHLVTIAPDGSGRRVVPVATPPHTEVRAVLSISLDGHAVIGLKGTGGCGCDEGVRQWSLESPHVLTLGDGSLSALTDPSGPVFVAHFTRAGGMVLRTQRSVEGPATVVVRDQHGAQVATWRDQVAGYQPLVGLRDS